MKMCVRYAGKIFLAARTVPRLAVEVNRFSSAGSSWLSGVGPDSGGLCEAVVHAGAVPQSRLTSRDHSQNLRSHQPPQISPVLQVTSAFYHKPVVFFSVFKTGC